MINEFEMAQQAAERRDELARYIVEDRTSGTTFNIDVTIDLTTIESEDEFVRTLNAAIMQQTTRAVEEYRAWVSRPV